MELALPEDIAYRLARPFAPDLIEWKPQATFEDNQGRDKALVVCYVDSRWYMQRLTWATGHNWSTDLQFERSKHGIIATCSLTVCGITRTSSGDCAYENGSFPNENPATTAEAQAFKRACSQFQLGLFTYFVPKTYQFFERNQRGKFKDWTEPSRRNLEELVNNHIVPEIAFWRKLQEDEIPFDVAQKYSMQARRRGGKNVWIAAYQHVTNSSKDESK